jgi:starch-binding outer membrane protein, SusD/RagB family
MKLNIKIAFLVTAALMSVTGCNKILEEHPQSQIVPALFSTPGGLLGGISGVYNDIRALWGTEGFTAQMVAGTDEHLRGASASGVNFYTYNGLSSGDLNGGLWNVAYTDINTLNGILEFGQTVDLPTATKQQYLAQAKFLRAFWYFHLVQLWGDVPLHLTFITSATTADSRQPAADVYTQIIKDLTDASTDLQPLVTAPFLGKAATKATALYLLGKAYLTRGWLTGAAADFTQASTVLSGLITNKATYGLDLWADYADAFKPANDYGKEVLFVSDHSIDTKYGQYTVGGGAAGGASQNLLPWLFRFNYPTVGVNTAVNPANGLLASSGSNMMTRDVANGRPFIRTRPNAGILVVNGVTTNTTNYIYGQAFADRVNDSRFEKTFQTVFIANTANITGTRGTLTVGVDTAIWLTPVDVVGAPQSNNGVPFKGIIVPPRLQDAGYFPVVKKYDDASRAAANFNDPSTRPVQLYRFSDVYLLAAEAYFKDGKPAEAAAMINAVRQRAAFRTTNTTAQNAAAVTAVTITPAQVTIDFILDERTREFYSEGLRWLDLVRTKSLISRVTTWNPVEAGANIKPFHVLRPIPQNQIDAVTEGPKFPQNTGY